MAIKRRKIPPLPVEFIALHPRIIGLPVAGFGMLLRIILHWWMTDCSPLPSGNDRLANIAHAHRPTWAAHRVEIMAIFEDVKSELKTARDIWQKRHDALSDLRRRGHSASRQRKIEKAMAAAPAIGSPDRSQIAERNRTPAPTETPLRSGFREKVR